MHSGVLRDCLPWLVVLVIGVIALRLLVRVSGARLDWRRLAALNRDEDGAVQSLSFVLTVPAFVMVVMLIVQVSQLMIGTMAVHYAAFAAARAAIVWIPADTGGRERENRISQVSVDPDADIPGAGTTYRIDPQGPKYEKIKFAAVMACVPISPSRDVGLTARGAKLDSLRRLYRALEPGYDANARISQRLAYKLAYSQQHTQVKIQFLHREDEPWLQHWWETPGNRDLELDYNDSEDYLHNNEVGWQDPIKVTVTHEFALLPGPGRLLARSTSSSTGRRDTVSESLQRQHGVYTREITASVTLGNEGEKSVIPFRHVLRD